MSDKLYALRRTVVNAVVGLVIAFLANLGFDIDSDALTIVLDGIVIGAWYLLSNWALGVAPDWLKSIIALLTGGKATPSYEGLHEAP